MRNGEDLKLIIGNSRVFHAYTVYMSYNYLDRVFKAIE